jgi:nitrite reductase (NADH) small subunit
MARHTICSTTDIPPGQRRIVTLEGRSIGVFNLKGSFYALKNVCPHQGAELCKGSTFGLMYPSLPGEYIHGREGEIIRCPWHGWEFDITNGKSIFDPKHCRVKTYEVEVVSYREQAQTSSASPAPEERPSVETYPVTIEDGMVVVTI